MKKLIIILGTISLITSGSSNLIACDNNTLTSEELAQLKAENSKIINGNKLEWIAPQEKPFNTVDDKWYVVIWRGDENNDWRIAKFHNNNATKELDTQGEFILQLKQLGGWRGIDLAIIFKNSLWYRWIYMDQDYFKGVYRWDGIGEPKMAKHKF